MTITTTVMLPPLAQTYSRDLLLSAFEWILTVQEDYTVKYLHTYRNGCNKRNKCKKIFQILEELNEWKKAEEKKEKDKIIIELINKFSSERGRIGKIIRSLNGFL